MNRRSVLLGAAALSACAHGNTHDDAHAVVRRAIDAAGGAQALRRARVLAWTGQAVVHNNVTTTTDDIVELSVDTQVQPFTDFRSTTWRQGESRATARTLDIDPTGGWSTTNDARTPLPAQQILHERQQCALYGLMRLVTLFDAGVTLELAPEQTENPQVRFLIQVHHPMATPTTLKFDTSYTLVEAENIVVDPTDSAAPNIRQWIGFSGSMDGARIRWPRRISVRQIRAGLDGGAADSAPYFDLSIETFTARKHLV